MPWGDSIELKIGEWVLAIGIPYQLNQTVTAGIISATGRTVWALRTTKTSSRPTRPSNRKFRRPLINARGELIGINTGLFSESGGYQGIGFARPATSPTGS